MERPYIEETNFDKIDFAQTPLLASDYENCKFNNCHFSNYDLSNINFSECVFTGCNFSMAKTAKTSLRDVQFKECKLLGIHFEDCDRFLLSFGFDHCLLNLSSFYTLQLKKTVFKNCSLIEVDFSEANLTESVFDHCDLTNALFDNSVLEKADLRTAYNYSINPERNKIRKAKFSLPEVLGLLGGFDIVID